MFCYFLIFYLGYFWLLKLVLSDFLGGLYDYLGYWALSFGVICLFSNFTFFYYENFDYFCVLSALIYLFFTYLVLILFTSGLSFYTN